MALGLLGLKVGMTQLLLEIEKDRPAGDRPRPSLMRQHPGVFLPHHWQLRPLVDQTLDHNAANHHPLRCRNRWNDCGGRR